MPGITGDRQNHVTVIVAAAVIVAALGVVTVVLARPRATMTIAPSPMRRQLGQLSERLRVYG